MDKMVQTKVYPHELIGEEIEIVGSNNTADVGIAGKVVDETKMTIKVEQDGKIKTLLKHNLTLKLVRTGDVIQGAAITKRPEDRIKGK